MGRSHTIIRNVTTNLTYAATVATLNGLAQDILALFQAGGTYDLGIDRVWVQWNDGATLDVVMEDDAMSAVSSNISTRNTTIETGLESLTPVISAVSTANIETFEQSALAVTNDVIIGVHYAADSWDEHWEDPNGAVPTGWDVDVTGTDPDTAVSYVAVGDGYAMQLVSDADGKAVISKAFTGLTTQTTWEIRAEIKAADVGTSNADIALTIRDGTKLIGLKPDTAGLRLQGTSTSSAAMMPHAITSGDWLTYWVRRVGDVLFYGIGPDTLHMQLYTTLLISSAEPGTVRLGNQTTGAKTATVRSFSILTGAVQEAPPSYTYRGTVHGR